VAALCLVLFLVLQKSKKQTVGRRQISRVIELLPDPTFAIDTQGRLIAWNRAMVQLSGVRADEILGKGNYEYAKVFYGERRPVMIDLVAGWNDETAEKYQDVRKRGDVLSSETSDAHRPFGNRYFKNTAGPLYDENGAVVGAIETVHDFTERRLTEKALAEREALLRQFIEYTPAAVAMCDTDMNYLAYSRRWATDYNLPDEDLRGRCHYDVFEVIPDHWKEQHRRCFQGEVIINDEEPFVRADGTRDWVRRSLYPWHDKNGIIGGLIMFTEVITRKKEVEENLRLVRRVLENSPAVLFRWEKAEGWPVSFVTENVNQFGYTSELFLLERINYASIIHPDDRERIRRSVENAVRLSKDHFQQEYRIVTRKGAHRWVDDRTTVERDGQGAIIRFQGVVLDITERKQAAEEVRKLRNYLSNIINSMPSVLVGVDVQGRVTQWNTRAERMTGIAFDQVHAQPLSTVYPDLVEEMDHIQTAIRDRRVLSEPKVARQRNGETRFEEVTIFPVVANGVEGAVIRVDDVTDRVHMEEMMIQSEKMLSVGGLAAGMAHEINNPLAGILQNTTVLQNRLLGDLPANQKAAREAGVSLSAIHQYLALRKLPGMLENIRTSGNQAASIVKNMLSFARKSDRIVSSHDIGSLLDQTIELARTDYDMKKRYDFKKIEIARDYEASLDPIPCEASKLQQVFLNILKNGAEAMAAMTAEKRAPKFVLRLQSNGPWVKIEIEDNGPGMPESTRRRVFEPFFTTKAVGEGTGLGLSVSYFIITENHGGKMDVVAEKGGGTRFIIRLPREGQA
jgi:PAS domain S-box-containing protein